MVEEGDEPGEDGALALDPDFGNRFERQARPPCQLYLISPLDVGGDFPVRLAEALDAGPIAAFQFRVKELEQHEAARLAEPLQRICGERDVAFIVNDSIALAGRLAADPLDGVEVLVVLPGAEEAGMGGMRAFLRSHALDPATTFVLGLDTVGSGVPVVARAEGALLPHAYRAEDLDLVDAGARRAGVEPPQRWRIAAYTDPVLARFAGLPCASLLSVSPETGMYTHYHRASDVPAFVDLTCVRACMAIAEGVGREIEAVT